MTQFTETQPSTQDQVHNKDDQEGPVNPWAAANNMEGGSKKKSRKNHKRKKRSNKKSKRKKYKRKSRKKKHKRNKSKRRRRSKWR